ncbi:hypothetical protein [Intestinibacter sp.]
MKRKYEKPSMMVEAFEANEYVAACYNLDCNVNVKSITDLNKNIIGKSDGCKKVHENLKEEDVKIGFSINMKDGVPHEYIQTTYWETGIPGFYHAHHGDLKPSARANAS